MGNAIYRKDELGNNIRVRNLRHKTSISSYQNWENYPQSPVNTIDFPYQFIIKDWKNIFTKLYVSKTLLSVDDIYEDFIDAYSITATINNDTYTGETKEYLLSSGIWDLQNTYTELDYPINVLLSDVDMHTIWVNYPQSPTNSSLAYSQACIVTDNTNIFLFISNNMLYFDSETSTINTQYINRGAYILEEGVWQYYSSDLSLTIAENGIIESNCVVYNTLDLVFPITDDQIYFYPTVEQLKVFKESNYDIPKPIIA